MKTTVTLLLSCVLLAACGGSGGGPAPGPGDTPGPSDADLALIQDALDACGGSQLASLLTIVRTLAGLADPTATLAPFVLIGVDTEVGVVNWEVDTGGDPGPDATGSIAFYSGEGVQIVPPFDLETVSANLGNLPTLVGQLADGTRMAVVAITLSGETVVNVTLSFQFQGGAAQSANGQGDMDLLGCISTAFFDGLDPTELDDEFPEGVVTMTLQAGDTAVRLVMTMDGTRVADTQAEVNAGDPFRVLLDLVTSEVSFP